MPNEIHPAQQPADVLLAECTVSRTRRSGPGGQHRNKVETAVVIEHRPTGLRGEAAEERSQARNHAVAVARLRLNLALSVRTPPSARLTDRWAARCRHGRITVSERHDDFPALISEALDVLSDSNWDHKSAADRLGCTSSQLTKLFRKSGMVFQWVNTQRERAGLAVLR